ncbi:MAG TPA: glycosyltransferase family A protein [Pyrinomonadaceae bacterium]
MSQEPFISVVIPTRNRGHLVPAAIQSVLWQDFDDYELIVSDNCSADGTAEAVREAAGERARYVRPDRVLSMPDHWEFALEHARGRFVAYLCDDDVWVPGALARVAAALESSRADLAVVYSGIYNAPNWLEAGQQNMLYLLPYTGEVLEHASDETIRRLYSECRVVNEAPRMLNSFFRRETLRRVRAEAGRLFLLCPDYSFAAMALTATPSWLYLDEPLHLQGVFPEGIGSTQTFNRGEPSLEFAREFKEERLLKHVPLKSLLVSNMITETLLLSKERLPALAGYEVDWANYFLSCRDDIETLGGNGVDTAADREEFERALAGQPAAVRERVAQGRVEPAPPQRGAARAAARRLISSSALLTRLEAAVRRPAPKRTPPRWLFGGEVGFGDILGCARLLPGLAGRESGAHR